MIQYQHRNVILQDDGSDGIYLVVKDEAGPIQEYAILPGEVAAIQEVTNKWLMANPGYNV